MEPLCGDLMRCIIIMFQSSGEEFSYTESYCQWHFALFNSTLFN